MRVLVFNRWLWKKWTLSAMDAYFLLCCWFYGDLGLSFCLLAIWPFLVLLAWNLWWSRLGGFWAVLLVACGDLWKRRDLGQGHYFAKGYYFDACLQVLIFFVSVNLLRVELHDESIFKFWIFTQVIICVVPGLFWEKRGTRIGASWQLNIVFVLVAVLSFNLWNMWLSLVRNITQWAGILDSTSLVELPCSLLFVVATYMPITTKTKPLAWR